MRTLALLSIPALSLLLLGAHLLHAGLWPLAVMAVLAVALLAVPRTWAARLLQVVLAFATIEWMLTAFALAQRRIAHDEPYLRLLLILGTVALFSAAAVAVFELPRLRRRFGTHAAPRSAALPPG
jgi:hypothetical protein